MTSLLRGVASGSKKFALRPYYIAPLEHPFSKILATPLLECTLYSRVFKGWYFRGFQPRLENFNRENACSYTSLLKKRIILNSQKLPIRGKIRPSKITRKWTVCVNSYLSWCVLKQGGPKSKLTAILSAKPIGRQTNISNCGGVSGRLLSEELFV